MVIDARTLEPMHPLTPDGQRNYEDMIANLSPFEILRTIFWKLYYIWFD